MPQTIGGWDVHTHIVPPAVVAAGGRGAFGMRASSDTLTICAHGVPLHPLSEVNKLADRVKSDHLDGAVVSVPPPLFRPDLSEADCRDYAKLVNEGLFEACRNHANVLRPLAYLPVEAPQVAADVAAELDGRWAGVVMGTESNDVSYASESLDPLWDGWEAPRKRNAWRYWNASSRSEFIRENTGRVLANLHAENGEYMRCRFTLISPQRGMAGGGEGRCQLSESGREINAEFPRQS